MFTKIPDELHILIIKIIIPALVAISIKLALQSRNGKVSIFNAIASIVTGVGCAYISSSWVMSAFSEEITPIAIAVITITGEKVAYWLIFKLNFDEIGDAFIDNLIKRYKK